MIRVSTRHLFSLLWALLFAALATTASAQELARVPASVRHGAAIEELRATLQEHVRSRLPGLSVAVGVGGRVVWAEGFGWADLEQQVPVRTVTRFRIGSVSKPITAAAVGQLVEDGLLDLDAPVQEYVEFPDKGHAITTRQLAGHLAGIRHYDGEDEFLSARRYDTVVEGLAIFRDDPLLFAPGEQYSYSSYGWNLVSAVVESAADRDFLDFMQERVFDRLGMTHTVPDHNHLIVRDRARPYVRLEDGRFQNAPYVDNSYKWAGGGFLSTPEDLVRFGMAHLADGFLEESTRDLLFTSLETNAGEETGYGIGWRIEEVGGRRVHQHGGGSVGGTTRLQLYPDTGVVVAMVSNLSQAELPDPDAIARRFAPR